MGLIQKVSFIRMCKCGKHGEIVLADGTTKMEFYSREVALFELNQLREKQLVTELEIKFLKDEISNLADVPEKASLADMALNMLIKSYEAAEETSKPRYVM